MSNRKSIMNDRKTSRNPIRTNKEFQMNDIFGINERNQRKPVNSNFQKNMSAYNQNKNQIEFDENRAFQLKKSKEPKRSQSYNAFVLTGNENNQFK